MSLPILFHFLCAQHVSDINMSIIRRLRLFCWITTLVVLFLVRCVLDFRCGWVGVVSVLQTEACNTDTTPTQPHRKSNTHRTKNNTTNVVIEQNSRKSKFSFENLKHIITQSYQFYGIVKNINSMWYLPCVEHHNQITWLQVCKSSPFKIKFNSALSCQSILTKEFVSLYWPSGRTKNV